MNDLRAESGLRAYVREILWERVLLSFQIRLAQRAGEVDFYAVDETGRVCVKAETLKAEGALRLIRFNLTNAGWNACIPPGGYRLFACRGEDVLAECEAEPDLAKRLDTCAQSFLYGSKGGAYAVRFCAEDRAGVRLLRMHVENDAGAAQSRSQLRKLLCGLYRFYVRLYRKKRKGHILFMTEQGRRPAGNLRAVADRLTERNADGAYEISYSARKASDQDQGIGSWIRLIRQLARSEYVFLDDHAPVLDWLRLSRETSVVQLWHGGVGFKSSGYSRWGHLRSPAPDSCHRQYRFGITGSEKTVPIFSEIWGICPEQVLPTGMPRMDRFQDAAYRERKTAELYEQFPLCKGKKVILFAPTYRGKNNADAHYPYQQIDLDGLYDICKDEYVVLFKMHPWVRQPIGIADRYSDRFLDVQAYPDINDLFYITDLLITDYSSNIYEYSLMRRPMVFFAFDRLAYAQERGFHNDYGEAAPGKVCGTFAEVLRAIAEQDFELEKVDAYVERNFDYFDSGACDRVIDWILRGEMPGHLAEALLRRQDEIRKVRSMDFSDITTI